MKRCVLSSTCSIINIRASSSREVMNEWLSSSIIAYTFHSLLLLFPILYTHQTSQDLDFQSQPQRRRFTWNSTTRAVENSLSFHTYRPHTRTSWWILFPWLRPVLILSSFLVLSRLMFSTTRTRVGPLMLLFISDPATCPPLYFPLSSSNYAAFMKKKIDI